MATRAQVRADITWAAGVYGANAALLDNIAYRESGYNVKAINLTDSNAAAGHPSQGIFQFIKSTFDAFAAQARKANPAAWRGVSSSWTDPKAQALTASWAIANGHGPANWTTYAAAMKTVGATSPRQSAKVTKAQISKWVTGSTKGLEPGLLDRLAQLGEALGKPLHIVSGYRTYAQQEQLYQKYLSGSGNLAAPPGQSNHESGKAADVTVDGVDLSAYPGAKSLASSLGLGFPVAGEAWHTEVLDPSKGLGSVSVNPLDAIPVAGIADVAGQVVGGGAGAALSSVAKGWEKIVLRGLVVGAGLVLIVLGVLRATGRTHVIADATQAASKGAMEAAVAA